MHPVGFPSIAWIPPYAEQVPAAITAQARGASQSIHSQVGIGWPVFESVPNEAQYPSSLLFSLGMDPSTTKMNGSWPPSAASRKSRTNSSPFSKATNGLLNLILGTQGN